MDSPSPSDELASDWKQQFLDQWPESAEPPDVFAFLSERTQATPAERCAVMLADQRQRAASGLSVNVEDYLDRDPEVAADGDLACRLVFQWRELLAEQGVSLDLDTVAHKYPSLKPWLSAPSTCVARSLESTTEKTLGWHSARSAAPKTIGRYQVERLLGVGAFGAVYLANDAELQRHVAIKVPRRAFDTPKEAEGFLSDARSMGRVEHPHIVPVYDVGSTDEVPCFIVTKYIEGRDLNRVLLEKRPSVPESVRLIATLADALHHLHKQGLVHSDIKPSNILVDSSGTPFLADFGLVLDDQSFGSGPTLVGTPAYMSPEQVSGTSHRVDGRSDVYSLGIVLYELLTGVRPFRSDSFPELREQISHLPPRPPRQIEDTIDRRLERVCLRAIAKDVTERYATALDFANDLKEAVDPKSWKSNTMVVGLVAAGVLGAAASVPFFQRVSGDLTSRWDSRNSNAASVSPVSASKIACVGRSLGRSSSAD